MVAPKSLQTVPGIACAQLVSQPEYCADGRSDASSAWNPRYAR